MIVSGSKGVGERSIGTFGKHCDLSVKQGFVVLPYLHFDHLGGFHFVDHHFNTRHDFVIFVCHNLQSVDAGLVSFTIDNGIRSFIGHHETEVRVSGVRGGDCHVGTNQVENILSTYGKEAAAG